MIKAYSVGDKAKPNDILPIEGKDPCSDCRLRNMERLITKVEIRSVMHEYYTIDLLEYIVELGKCVLQTGVKCAARIRTQEKLLLNNMGVNHKSSWIHPSIEKYYE